MIREAEVGKGKTYYTAVHRLDGREAEKVGERGFNDAEGGWETRGKHDGSNEGRKGSERCLDLNQRKRRRARRNESAQYE